jgi:predicted ATP-dependent endonuclease of OLD family
LIGTNGGGKSTILGAAALAYKNTTPRTFFPKASIGDDAMADWRFEAEILDRDRNNEAPLQRTARFAQLKWRRDDFLQRDLLYIEIQRTVPAGEVSRFKRFLRDNPKEIELINISEDTIKYASAVLDRDVSNYRIARIRANPDNMMYVCAREGAGYSQFHFGAGEASIISTIDRIENAEDNSLVLIEEVENGLHPAAVRLFTRYLMRAARRRRLQVIFTTHSQNAIDELPPEGIWACINARVFNGKLTVESLRAVTGNAPGRLEHFHLR